MARKILIFGYGNIGSQIARSLHLPKNSIIVVDTKIERVELAKEDGYEAYDLDLSSDENLRKVGVGGDVTDFYCVTSDKELNLYVTLTARSIDMALRILSRADYAHEKKKLLLAGADETIDFNEIGANKIFHLLRRPTALQLIESLIYKKNDFFHSENLHIVEIEIPCGSFLDGEHFHSASLTKKYDLLILGILDRQMGRKFIFNLSGYNHKMDGGDILVLVGRQENIAALKRDLYREETQGTCQI